MFRRSRFSIRPNVGTAGRTAAAAQEAASVNREAGETSKDAGEGSAAAATAIAAAVTTDGKSVATPSEKPTAPGDGSDQTGDAASSSAAVQRRKRVTVKPKVAPGRPSTFARTLRSPTKAVPETPVEIPGSDLDKPTTSIEIGTRAPAPQGLQSPRRRRPSEDSKQPKVQPKPTLTASNSPGPAGVSPAEDSQEQTLSSGDSLGGGKPHKSTSTSQAKEVPSKPSEKVLYSIPDREATELSEKARTLVSSKSGYSQSPSKFSLSRLLNDPSDLQRLAKARRLRELLKQEMHKEKAKAKKYKARTKEYDLDPAKMTMRDLIRYLPLSNPMTSSLEEAAQENETIIPPSPERAESSESAREPEVDPKDGSPEEEVEAGAAEDGEEEDEDALMVPQVKVAEDGSLIIDEESLTVEVLRSKGPNPVQGRDPIFERGSTTTYSSFRKGTYSKPWSNEETDMFFLAISMVGTDFSMICQLFPHRERSEIKNKFKKEERTNAWRIDKAFRDRRKLDIEYFSKLLTKILEVQKTRKKLKSLSEKNAPKKHKRKTTGKKARKLSDVDEEDEDDEGELPDLEEEEGEKENEGGTPVSKPKRKRKRKNEEDASTEETNDKKKQSGEKSNAQDEAFIPEDAEAALPEDRTNSDISDQTEIANTAKNTAIKPAKLSRGRAPKLPLLVGRKAGKKPPPASTKDKDGDAEKEDDQSVNKEASPSREANERESADNVSSEDEDYTVQPPRPTRYGRVPKPTKHLNYLAKEDANSSGSETTPASQASAASEAKPKAKCTTKRKRPTKAQPAQEPKKPKLVTLRASQSDFSDEEDENERGEDEEEEQWAASSSAKDSSAPAFVPATLRSPNPAILEVEETMEELDILANMPDVLGIPQDALFPEAQNETDTAEPCEHQLDLLVDVIDFLSTEHTEVSEDESYNEAAQTLLTIGNLAHLAQSTQNQTTTQDHVTVIEIAEMSVTGAEVSATPPVPASSGDGVTETSESVALVQAPNTSTDKEPLSQIGDSTVTKTSDQTCSEQKVISDMDSTPQLQSSQETSKKDSAQTRRGRIAKVKPKVNLGRASRTTMSKNQPDTSKEGTAGESQAVAPDLSQVTEIQPAAEEMTHNLAASIDNNNSSENQNQSFSGTQFEPSLEPASSDTRSTDVKLTSRAGIIEGGCNYPAASDTTTTESQVKQSPNADSLIIQESIDCAAASLTCAVELPICQQEESEVASATQTRMSRFQKVKPKPKLPQTPRTVRSKPPTTNDVVDKDTSSAPNLESPENTIAEIESQPSCSTSPTKPSQTTSVLMPSLDFGSALIPTVELSSTDEKNTDVGPDTLTLRTAGESQEVAHDHSQVTEIKPAAEETTLNLAECQSASIINDVSSENKNQGFFGSQFECSWEPATSDTKFIDEKLTSLAGIIEGGCDNPATSDTAATESQVEQSPNTDSLTIQESSDCAAASVTCGGELPVCQNKESEVTSANHTKKSRFQKVKPKPKLPQTPRTVRAKPQTTKDVLDKDTSSAPNLESPENTIAEIESQPSCSTSPTKPSQTTSVLMPSLGLGSALIPTVELSSTDDGKSQVVDPDHSQVTEIQPAAEEPTLYLAECRSASINNISSENQNQSFSKSRFEPSLEPATSNTRSTDVKLISHAGIIESGCNVSATSDKLVTEAQVKQKSDTDSNTLQENSEHSAAFVTPAEELPVCQKEESEAASSNQTKKSRFQKVKPKPKLPQTSRPVRAKPQATNDAVEKDGSSTLNLESTEKIPAEIESQPTCTTSPKKPSQSTSILITSLDLGSTLIPTEELSSTEERNTDLGLVNQIGSSTVTLDKIDPEPQLDPSWEKATKDLGSTSESLDKKLGSHVETTSSRQGSDNVEELPVSQKEESEVATSCQTRSPTQTKSNLSQTSGTLQSKHQITKEAAVHMQLVNKTFSPTSEPQYSECTVVEVEPKPTCSTTSSEKLQGTGIASILTPSSDLCCKPTEELSSTKEKNTNVLQQDSRSESSEPNVSQRRRRIAKAKPNLGSSTRTTQSKQQPKDIGKFSAQHSSNVTPEPVDSKSGQTELEPTMAKSSVAENQTVLTVSTAGNKCSEKLTVEGESTEGGTSSHTEGEASKDCSTESKIESVPPADLPSTSDPKESTQQQHSENESEIKGQDSVQQGSETTEADQTNNKSQIPTCTDDTPSSIKAPLGRRGRLIKPKPNVGRSSRPSQPQQVEHTPQAPADSGTCSGGDNASGLHRPVTQLQPDTHEPVDGGIGQLNNRESSPNAAGASSGCATQEPQNSTQDATSSTAGSLTCENITTFPDMPSDPDEPFFILSLTEIPVYSSGEVLDSTSEPSPYLSTTDASIQQQSSVPGEAAGRHVDLSNVLEPVSMEDIGPDPFAFISPIKENPLDPHESTRNQPPEVPNTVEDSEETSTASTNQKGTRRRAKLQVKPCSTRKKQASKTLAAKEPELIPVQANSTQDSELPGPSVQPEAFVAKAEEEIVTEPHKGSIDHVDVEKEESEKNPDNSSSGAHIRGSTVRNRKPKGFLSDTDGASPSNNPQRGKAPPKGPKVKSAQTSRKQCRAAPEASTTHVVAPTIPQTQTPEEPVTASSTTSAAATEADIEPTTEHSQLGSVSPPSTSQYTAEVSQQSDCVESSLIEDEPTSVSQYFLSDIFTEVEDG